MDQGAHFYRCDFQVHSPRDLRWAGPDCVSDEERRQYAVSFVQACRKEGLDAVAVTDHHDLMFAKYVRDAARAERDGDGNALSEEKRLVVFPGIELTLNVPCQALVIFDADFPDDLFSLVLTALAITPNKADQAKTAETKRLDHITTLEKLREELDKHEYLRNRYIILPNISDGGEHTLLRKGNAPKYASMPCVGGYIDGGLDKFGKGNQAIIEGKTSEYGNKRIALFQTSDSRRADHTHLGKYSTWVKWATPTAEALRQACLAQESRVSQSEPELPGVAITSLSVSNSVFLGPIEVEFNPQYNALIGGRGTGKSTILEYLRWALCDQLPNLADEDELPNYQLRRKTLIEKTLQAVNAVVQVSFTVNGIQHVVRRNSKTDELLLKVGDGEFAACKEGDIRTLLPIQAYSQKQLSNVSVRLEELSRFIEAPIRGSLDDIEKTFARAANEVRQLYATLLRKRRLESQLTKDELLLESLNEQASNVRLSLGGLSKEDTELLAAKPRYDQAEEALQAWTSDVLTVGEILDDAAVSLNALPTNLPTGTDELPHSDTLGRVKAIVADYIAEVKNAIGELQQRHAARIDDGSFKGNLGETVLNWRGAAEDFEDRYEAAKGRASVHQTKLEQLSQLEKRITDLRSSIGRARREINGLGMPETQYAQVRESWTNAKLQRAQLIEAECEKLTKRSNGEIRATVRTGGGVDEVLNQLRQATAGSGLRREKIEAIGEMIRAADNPDQKWNQILEELQLLAAYDANESGDQKLPNCAALKAGGLGNADLAKIAARLNEDTWLEISLSRLQDRPQFEYRAREAEYIPFTNASAGQQATALLKALLNQPGPPLIIDQPEEDLDNPVILDVVRQIWQAKKARQLVLSSHNANLVVNGDAELVVWCDYRTAGDQSRGQVRGAGAIDIPVICDAIKRVMEGGEAAFKLRKEKYGF